MYMMPRELKKLILNTAFEDLMYFLTKLHIYKKCAADAEHINFIHEVVSLESSSKPPKQESSLSDLLSKCDVKLHLSSDVYSFSTSIINIFLIQISNLLLDFDLYI